MKRRREHRNLDEVTDAELEELVGSFNIPRMLGQAAVGALMGFRDHPCRRYIHELYAQMDGMEAGYRFRIRELEQELQQKRSGE